MCVALCGGIGVSTLQAQLPVTSAPANRVSLPEAVQSTLQGHPLLASQLAQLKISKGLKDEATGAFDLTLQSAISQSLQTTPLTTDQQQQNLLIGLSGQSDITRSTAYSIGLSKLFRNGITFSPQFQLSRNVDNLFSTTGINTSAVGIVFTIPFLRGRGKTAVDAQEVAATHEVEAAQYDFSQVVAQLIANTATSYWNTVAASRNVAIANEAEERGKTYRDNVKSLVEADHVPRSDLNEVTANLAQRASNRIAAMQQWIAAQQQLALDMGLSADRLFIQAPEPADEFPDATDQPLPSDSNTSMQAYLALALGHRADYLAVQRRIAERQTLVKAAENRLLPQLNLNATVGYSGLQTGRGPSEFFLATTEGVLGPNASVGLTYSFPLRNHSARGVLAETEGATQQAEMQRRDLARSIGAAVVVALENVRNAVLRVKAAGDAVRSYRSALEGERDKYKGGIGSIVDILTVEDRLTSALTDQVDAERVYSLALVQFRFATGTLSPPDNPLLGIQANTLVTLP